MKTENIDVSYRIDNATFRYNENFCVARYDSYFIFPNNICAFPLKFNGFLSDPKNNTVEKRACAFKNK